MVSYHQEGTKVRTLSSWITQLMSLVPRLIGLKRTNRTLLELEAILLRATEPPYNVKIPMER